MLPLRRINVWMMLLMLAVSTAAPLVAHADPPWERGGRWDRGRHNGWYNNRGDWGGRRGWDRGGWDRRGWRNESYGQWKTNQIIKGGLVGAGIGAGAAVLTDRPLLKPTLVGAGIGAGIQALRY